MSIVLSREAHLELEVAAAKKVAADATLVCMSVASTAEQMLERLGKESDTAAYIGVIEVMIQILREHTPKQS